ncbi:MAG TPA: aminotransferase class V-fold PLP-dependent enzyme [Puia sp.]|nr:aminotransferase class V-fold PLP-dependent enzyme [Puia sp.]
MNKRTFLKSSILAGAGLPFHLRAMADWISGFDQVPAGRLAADEVFWAGVRAGYRLNPDFINLENGYYCVQPNEVLEAFVRHVREVNLEGAHYMRTVQFDNKKAVAARLAALAGCSPDELVITRNTTESLDMIIGGYPWAAGDEAIMALQDYGAMLKMFRQVEKRHGVKCVVVSVPNHPASDDEVVEVYARAITPRTRLLMVSHMVNISGQILPVRKICEMAHARGVEVMVDGAHTFAQVRHSVPELGCDYYGASLHKWLSAPLGAGVLYVASHVRTPIWPLLAEPDDGATGIARLNHTGTAPVHTDLAIGDALDYYTSLGADRKESRLRYLQQYWTSKVREMPYVVVNTPLEASRTCAIANVGIKGMTAGQMAERLMKEHKIYTVAIDMPEAEVVGCRVTPNVYSSLEELDKLVEAVRGMG